MLQKLPRRAVRHTQPGVMRVLAAGLGLALGLVTTAAHAEPIRRTLQLPRGLALGGTGISYADDEMGLYYNPAALVNADSFWIEILPVAVESSPEGWKFLRDRILKGQSNLDQLSGVAELVDENLDKDLHFRVFLYPTAVLGFGNGWTFALGGYSEDDLDLKFSMTTDTEAYYRHDRGVATALSIPLVDGQFAIGLGARTIKRKIGQGTISPTQLAMAVEEDESGLDEILTYQEGRGAAFDLGLVWRLPVLPVLRSQLATSYQNIGDVDLGEAGEIPAEVSVGWSARPQFTDWMHTLWAIEYRGVTQQQPSRNTFGKRIHGGLELGFIKMDNATNLLTLRTGYGSGGVSYGIELALWHYFSIQYVVYSQEYGESVGDDQRKRRLWQINFLGF